MMPGDPAQWRLTELVPEARRAMLLRPISFESLAHEFAQVGHVLQPRTRSLASKGRDWRAEFTVQVPADSDLVDVFHNGIKGYWAQYLRGDAKGDRANDLMVELLKPKLIEAWQGWPRCKFDIEWLIQGIGAGAKVWVHQGMWAYHVEQRPIRVEIAVEDWLRHQTSTDRKVRKKVKLGALRPREYEIDVKCLFLSPDAIVAQLPKPPQERARQIHMYGFT
jgi:hypothetical protein